MFEFTTLGWVHTLLSLVALASGIAALASRGEITADTGLGKTYLVTTALTALTAFGIFRHGGFGPGHILAILALLAIGAGLYLGRNAVAGSWRQVGSSVAISFTLLCHLIPGATETLTRIPAGHPFADSPQSPALRGVFLGLLVAFFILAILQTRMVRNRRAA